MLLVADTDLLSNPLWLQEQPGHNEPQVWADNDLFVGNALDYLSGSDALIDLRSRGHTKRPFTRVEALRREAGMRAQEQLNALQQSLNDTDKNLRALQQSMDDGDQEVTPEMEATLRRFIDDKLRIRQQLRQLQFQLNADVERLAEQVKLANTVLLPALLTLLLLLHWSRRSMRRRRADMRLGSIAGLALALALFAGTLGWLHERQQPPAQPPASRAWLPGLKPHQVTALCIATPGQPTIRARRDGKDWTLASKDGYPASGKPSGSCCAAWPTRAC